MTEANIAIEDVQSGKADKIIKLVTISGQLDESNIDEKSKQIYDLINQIPQNLNLILNLENLEYMNSKSIGYLTDWYGKISSANGKIVIMKAKQNIADILNVVGLTQLIPMFTTVEEAKFAILGEQTA
ncbi:anti-sigma factor antagonist [Candidatus Peregrinibacteria bacterium]|nr:anti-sigma factor antagonist [Candidatus Peregrinibacteria bacterium]